MNFKKLVAGLVSASILATTAIVTPVVANAENDVTVTVNIDTNWFSSVIFTDAAVEVTVNQNDKTGANWVQVDRQTWNEETKTNTDNDYTAAFGNSSESGYTQSVSFSTDMTSVSATLISFSNTYSKDIAYNVTIDTTKATNGSLNIGVKGNGDPASEKTNNWYYVTPCTVEVIAAESETGSDTSESELVDLTSKFSSGIAASELEKYESIEVTYTPDKQTVCGHTHDTVEDYCSWAKVAFVANSVSGMTSQISDSKKSTWYQPTNIVSAGTGVAEESQTVTVSVADIIDSFTSDADWEESFTLETITTTGWNASVVSIKGVPAAGEEEEDLLSGVTDDGTEFVQLPADEIPDTNNSKGDNYPANTVIDNKTYAQVNGTTWRIYRAVSTEELANYSSASVVIKNKDTGKAFKLTTSTVYQVLNAGDPTTEGVVYVVFVINNVSNIANNSIIFTSDLVWSDITLE